MTFSLLLLLGATLTLVVLIGQRKWMPTDFVMNISLRLRHSRVTQNVWLAGAALFLANMLLFSIALLFMFIVPFGMALTFLICIPLSLYVWYLFSELWQGSFKGRFGMASIGSTFFLFFMGWVLWSYFIVEPYPGDDNFMRFIGLIISSVGSIGAVTVSLFVILRNN